MPGNRTWRWIRWILFAEGLILLLALAGPGSNRGLRRSGDHGLIARWFLDDPAYLEAVAVNFAAANLFIGAALFAAWLSARRKKRSGEGGRAD